MTFCELWSFVVIDINMSILSVNEQDIYPLSGRLIRAASTVVATLPIRLVYPFLQRYFVYNIRLGAVRG
jgi:ABC-type glycerol-3-phosphate transport system permease component